MSTQTDIPADLCERAAALAAESGHSAREIIDRALRHGLDTWEREFRLIQEAIEQADRGEFATDDQVDQVRNKYRPGA
ncbi:MAG: CopG family ribbon-helix-helix protein [Gammaproteobacteria bacterium]